MEVIAAGVVAVLFVITCIIIVTREREQKRVKQRRVQQVLDTLPRQRREWLEGSVSSTSPSKRSASSDPAPFVDHSPPPGAAICPMIPGFGLPLLDTTPAAHHAPAPTSEPGYFGGGGDFSGGGATSSWDSGSSSSSCDSSSSSSCDSGGGGGGSD